MLQQIIDRRLAGKNKSIGNRERFLRRYKEQIREAVKRAVDGRGIRDMERGEEVRIPKKDVSEPVFHHGQGGVREVVHPGNKDYVRGDRIERPKGGATGGSGKGQASDTGEGEDDFTFSLRREEFMQVFFDDLALPHLVRTQLAETPEWKSQRAGFTADGTPTNLHVVRSMRGAAEEAPGAYKDVGVVVESAAAAGLARQETPCVGPEDGRDVPRADEAVERQRAELAHFLRLQDVADRGRRHAHRLDRQRSRRAGRLPSAGA